LDCARPLALWHLAAATQRGTGLPEPTYRRDRSFDDHPLNLKGASFDHGLGCAAHTVLIYDLNGRYDRFRTKVGVDQEVANAANPPASLCFTVFVDGNLRFDSSPMLSDTPPKEVDVSVRGAGKLMLRMSCNWDHNGDSRNDHGDWADARLVGQMPHRMSHMPRVCRAGFLAGQRILAVAAERTKLDGSPGFLLK